MTGERCAPEKSVDNSAEGQETRRCVLFADVCDSSRLYRELGDERARHLVGAALDLAREAIEMEGGYVVDTIGDEVFCLLPDGDAGLRCATRIHEHVGAERDRGALPLGLGFRIGLVHGPVGLSRDKVFGDTVYMAKRISTQAKYEQVLLDRETFLSLKAPDTDRFRRVESLRLKGRVDEIELIEALWGPDVTADAPGLQPTLPPTSDCVLKLHIGERMALVSKQEPFVTLGRGDSCHLIVADGRVSRLHARVELVRGEFIWMDQSRNGSVIHAEGRPPRTTVRQQVVLTGSGRIQLGPDSDSPVLLFQLLPDEAHR